MKCIGEKCPEYKEDTYMVKPQHCRLNERFVNLESNCKIKEYIEAEYKKLNKLIPQVEIIESLQKDIN